ncbi:MAG: pyridoxamine 5'-phosphate oxidase [Aquificota bacterium]|nr:MAG: pyridoxamine 5'-phosphate oxidase [Aquificota bacterium]
MSLNEKMYNSMQDLTPVVISTAFNNRPYTTFITWAIAKDENTVRVAVSTNSKTVENIKENPHICIELFDEDTALSILGEAKILKENIEDISFPVSIIEINVKDIRDNLFPGATVKGKIPFEHTGDIKKAEELDNKVLKALKE